MNIPVLVLALGGTLVLGLGFGYISGRRESDPNVVKIMNQVDYLETEQVTKRKFELATVGCLRCLHRFEKLLQGEWI